MPFQVTTATRKVAGLTKRIRLLAGGTSASKTISSLMYLITMAQQDTSPTLTSVVSESFPHLRRGAIRDFMNIMQAETASGVAYWDDNCWNKSEFTYTFPLRDPVTGRKISDHGSKIEFFSADMPSKVRGPRRDRLFVNEANNIARESWEQLLLRTRQFAIADWNPVAGFYMYDDYGLIDEPEEGLAPYALDDDTEFLILTYKDNEALEPAIVKEIEKRRINASWWRVYGEGKRGEIEGLIFTGWKIYDEVPHEARLVARGLDFGYSRDPNALCDLYYYNGGYIVDELAYRIGMKNRQTADLILNQEDANVLTIADSAELKSIEEMQEYGVNIIGVEKKGAQGIPFTNWAIQWVQSQRMGLTKRSTNYIKSYRNFMWQFDKDGNVIGNPPKYDHFYSDGMMSVVYAMTSVHPSDEDEEEVYDSGNLAGAWL